jgi:hypothetical protein
LNTEQRFAFKANYSVNTEVDLPPAGGHVVGFAHEGSNLNIGLDGGLLCKISPDGRNPWMANFQLASHPPRSVNGIFSTPNPEIVCVVAGGCGYWLDVFKQTKLDIQCSLIRQVKIIQEFNLLVFVDYTNLVAYDFNGLKWRSDRLALDELIVIDQDNSELICEGLDNTASSTMRFKVNISSGYKKK